MGSLLFYPEISTKLVGAVSSVTHRVNPELISRIRRAYHLSVGNFDGYGESGWRGIVGLSSDVHDCLMSKGDTELGNMLANPGDTNLFFGFDSLIRDTRFDASSLPPLLAMIFDGLVRLAEAVGVERIWNEAATEEILVARPRNHPGSIDELLTKVGASIGRKIVFPNPFPREGGLKTANGIACYRSPHAIYQAWRVRDLAGKNSDAKVLEIGAGLGRTAYYAQSFGVSNYTIVDLPMTNVAQALFLGMALGPDRIWVPGDPEETQGGRIRIFPPQWFRETEEHFEVVLNADSMTEMDRGHAKAYIEKISRKSRVLLSINHENNSFTVRELCDRKSSIGRFPYWLRKGYLEELFAFDGNSPPKEILSSGRNSPAKLIEKRPD